MLIQALFMQKNANSRAESFPLDTIAKNTAVPADNYPSWIILSECCNPFRIRRPSVEAHIVIQVTSRVNGFVGTHDPRDADRHTAIEEKLHPARFVSK